MSGGILSPRTPIQGSRFGTRVVHQQDTKNACMAAAPGNIDISTLGDGDVVDGVTLVEGGGNCVLLPNQSDPIENGSYLIGPSGGPSVRAPDFNVDSEVTNGVQVPVVGGATGGGTWTVTTADPIIVDTTAITIIHTYKAILGNLGGFANGSYVTPPVVLISEAGGTVSLDLDDGAGGTVTVQLDEQNLVTPASSIALVAGTDINPQINYVWVEQNGAVAELATDTANWPVTEHSPLAVVLVQSAASVQIDGAYKVHAWIDHVVNTTTALVNQNMGHMADLNMRWRVSPAQWAAGVEAGITITPNGGAPDNVHVDTDAGVVFQLHKHEMPARDTGAGDPAFVVNDSVASFDRITDLNALLTDSSGGDMTGRHFSLTVWGVVNELGDDCKLMLNLPGGSYATQGQLEEDPDELANFDIPADFTGVGFLVAQILLGHSPAASGTWTLHEIRNLRGKFPSTTPSGSSTIPNDVFVRQDGTSQMTGPLQILDTVGVAHSRLGTNVTGHGLAAADDLLISGLLEVDDEVFFDGIVTCGTSLRLGNADELQLGNGQNTRIAYSTVQASDSLLVAVSNTSKSLLITDVTGRLTDFGLGNQSDPTIVIQSGDETSVLQRVRIMHDQTSAVLASGFGGHSIVIDGYAGAPGLSGSGINVPTFVFTDDDTTESGTAAAFAAFNFEAPTLAAANLLVGTTVASTVRISGSPIQGTNQTITERLALLVDGGAVRIDGTTTLGGAVIVDAKNIILSTGTGTKLGTTASQKLGFWGVAPVIQEAHIADTTDVTDVAVQFNKLLLALETEGLLASV